MHVNIWLVKYVLHEMSKMREKKGDKYRKEVFFSVCECFRRFRGAYDSTQHFHGWLSLHGNLPPQLLKCSASFSRRCVPWELLIKSNLKTASADEGSSQPQRKRYAGAFVLTVILTGISGLPLLRQWQQTYLFKSEWEEEWTKTDGSQGLEGKSRLAFWMPRLTDEGSQ